MGFNEFFSRFPEILSSPFSARKRKRAQAEPLSDSYSARPTKQLQTASQPSKLRAVALSHQSNSRVPALPVQKQSALLQPADQDVEASSAQELSELQHNTAAATRPSTSGTDNWTGAHPPNLAALNGRAYSSADLKQLQPYSQVCCCLQTASESSFCQEHMADQGLYGAATL